MPPKYLIFSLNLIANSTHREDITINEENYKLILKDSPNKALIDVVNALYIQGYSILVYTPNKAFIEEITRLWLNRNDVKYNKLVDDSDTYIADVKFLDSGII